MKIAVLASGSGSNLQVLIDRLHRDESSGIEIAVVIGDWKKAYALTRARNAGVPTYFVDAKDFPNREAFDAEISRLVEVHDTEVIALAGYMKLFQPPFVRKYRNRIINIHPSLLPSFPGPQAYRQAYEHGVKIAGVTAHFVSMQLDEGPVIAQESFHIKSGMTLKQIVTAGQQCEAKTLVKAVKIYLTKRLDVHWGVVKEV